MNDLLPMLAARAHDEGRGLRQANLRHRRFNRRPLAMVLFQLGAEPFSTAAIGYGHRPSNFRFDVSGEPRSRDLNFIMLGRVANVFNPWFRSFAADPPRGGDLFPQLIVPNAAHIVHLYQQARRMAYLTNQKGYTANPAVVEMGDHLMFMCRRYGTPGQQMVLSMVDLFNDEWVVPFSLLEREFLPTLLGYIEPFAGMTAFESATYYEGEAVGPAPAAQDDIRLEPLLETFENRRGGSIDPHIYEPLLGPIRDHYRPLIRRSWDWLWQAVAIERVYREAPSVGIRAEADREAYLQHLAFIATGKHYKAQPSLWSNQIQREKMELAQHNLRLQEACDDPLRLLPYFLQHKAVYGTVSSVNSSHTIVKVRTVRRPLVIVDTVTPCLMPVGKALWSLTAPDASHPYLIQSVVPLGAGSRLTLMLDGATFPEMPPSRGDTVCYSELHVRENHRRGLTPPPLPWTHQ